MDLIKILDSNASILEKEESNILTSERKTIQEISPELISIFDHFIKANKGGKKIRGFLVRLGFEMTRGSTVHSLQSTAEDSSRKSVDIHKVAAAYEILHTSILSHDDIIDKSPKRRGLPSLYKSVGVKQAITLADYGFFLAMKIISESKFDENLKIKALNLFSKTVVETAIGQMMDIQKEDPFTIMKLKTAKYTIAGPLQIGVILGGARAELIRDLGEFGENLGIAFQIKDDILDGEVGSMDEAKKNALEYADKARKIIPKLTKQPKMRELLNEIVNYMVERNN